MIKVFSISFLLLSLSVWYGIATTVLAEFVESSDAVEVIEVVSVKKEREVRLLVLPNKEVLSSEVFVDEEVSEVVEIKDFSVPFYSQFSDITSTAWQRVGCGIASIAMLISFYEEEAVSVDDLLSKGIAANAFLSDAGWIHSGLINLSREYGLDGESLSFTHLTMEGAFYKLLDELEVGPVMASVHYTFEPTNPIPHLVVVNGVRDGKVFYNDPAESVGGGSISIEKFKAAWKKRYIKIRPL